MQFTNKILLLAVSILFTNQIAQAEVKTFMKEYAYEASELDSKVTSRINALEQVKRMLLEELGVFLTSQTVVVNSQLTKDQITSITAGIVSAVVLDEKWDGHKYWLKAKIEADPTVVQKTIEIIRTDTKKTSDLEAAGKQIESLTKQLEGVKNDLSSSQAEKQFRYNKIVDRIKASDMMQEYYRLSKNIPESNQISYLSEIIKIDPENSEALSTRAALYKYIKFFDKYESDLKKMIDLDRYNSYAYAQLAEIYLNKKDYSNYINYEYNSLLAQGSFYMKLTETPLKVYDFLVKKYPNNYKIYLLRGYFNLCNIKPGSNDFKAKAIKDINKSIKLNEKQPIAYYLIARLYEYSAENYALRVSSPELVNEIISYCSLGLSYDPTPNISIALLSMRSNYGESSRGCDLTAIDIERMIELKPNYSPYYQRLAVHNMNCDEYNRAIFNYNKAVEHEKNVGSLQVYYEELAKLYTITGETQSAIRLYNQMLSDIDIQIDKYRNFIKSGEAGSMSSYFEKRIETEAQLKAQIRDRIFALNQ